MSHSVRIPTRRTFLTAGLGGAALAGLAACSGGGSGSPGGGDGASGEGGADALPAYVPYTAVEPDLGEQEGRTSNGFFAYPAEPRAYADGTPGDGQPITAMVPTAFAIPPTMNQNAFWQELNERLGSELNITATPSGEYDAKFATTVAGDTLSDFFYVGSTQSLPQFMAAKAADLTDHLAGVAINDYPALANLPTASWQECIFEGRIRALPIQRGLMSQPAVLVRADLLAAQGVTEPPADFEDLAALSTQLTGGNTWAWGSFPLGYVRSMLDIPSYWFVDGGEFATSLEDERHQDALEAVRTLQQAGVINPDAAVAPSSTLKDWFGAGTSILHNDSFVAWFSLYNQYSSVEGLEIQAYPVIGFDGGIGTQQINKPNVGITAISADSDDRIETLLKVADYHAAPFGTEEYLFIHYGIEGIHYDLDGPDPAVTERASEINIGSIYISDASRVIYSAKRQETVQSAWDWQHAVSDKSFIDPTNGLYSETASQQLASLRTNLESAEIDIILGRRPVSDWTAAVEAFMSGGGSQILDEYKAAHAALQS
ncbi:extracellular solute-binding protein [Pseudactinotalea sp.]|uniref:extracellular solute-binding protein n=1 Tax=Pseudactinotalea sp. TaxID=1926260 RepID=UPI003B3BB44E